MPTGRILPRVGLWLAWNEPNNPVFLQPQFARVRGKWAMEAPAAYARICNAVYAGVHAAGGPERVACGATAPRGSNNPYGSRPSISPLTFLRAAKEDGLRRFDAWAHHPYYGSPAETPRTRHVGQKAVGLGNIGSLISAVTRLYGPKPLWITEYGYQTKPPDPFFGVSLDEAGRLPTRGVRDRAREPAHRPVHVVPAQGQPRPRGLAVGAAHRERTGEAVVRRVRRPARRLRLAAPADQRACRSR